MGQDISPIDLINIKTFAARVISLAEYRHKCASVPCAGSLKAWLYVHEYMRFFCSSR